MNISTVKIISVSAMLGVLGVGALPAAAQDAASDYATPDTTAQINPSLGLTDAEGVKLGRTQGGMLLALNTENPAFTGKHLILAQNALREIGSPESEPLPIPYTETQNESAIVDRTSPPPQRVVSGLDHGAHVPLLKQSTIGNLLVGLKKKYDPKIMTQSGDVYWFFDSQKDLATGNKTRQLLACSKMLRWWSVCASTNARNVSLYIRNL